MKRRPENYVTLEFLSRSSNEGFARLAAAAFAAQLDPTLDELGDIKTAVSEAVTNAIVHAYPNQLGKIVMKLRLLENQTLELVIRDWGCGMADVEQARQPHVHHRRRGAQRYGLHHHGELYESTGGKVCPRQGNHRHHA